MTYKPGMTPAEMQKLRDRQARRTQGLAAGLQGAQLTDLRRAFETAFKEIRHLNRAIEKQAKVMLEQHNNFRAMKGLPPDRQRPGGQMRHREASNRRQAFLRQVRGWYFP